MKAMILLATLIALPVFANDSPQPKPSQPVAISGAAAGASAGSQSASSVGDIAASAGASLDASGNVSGSSNYASDFNSLALALPGVAGAARGQHVCLESFGGKGGLSIGTGGRTELNEACLTHHQCMDRADRYAEWGRVDMALAQLAACDGVEVTEAPVVETPDLTGYATKDELERVRTDLLAK